MVPAPLPLHRGDAVTDSGQGEAAARGLPLSAPGSSRLSAAPSLPPPAAAGARRPHGWPQLLPASGGRQGTPPCLPAP